MPKRPWTGREVGVVLDHDPDEGPHLSAKELGRSEDSVTSFANRLGLRSLTRGQRQAVWNRPSHGREKRSSL